MDARAPVQSDAPILAVTPLLRATLCTCWAMAMLSGVVRAVAAVGRAPGRTGIFDFHAFLIAGRLTWTGHLADAYHARTMLALEQQLGGQKVFMPWSYPPLFGVVMAPFSRMPIALGFSLFVLITFALFLVAVSRLAPRWGWLVLLTLAPCIVINLCCGQNGFLTGALFAFAAAAFIGRRPGQGGLAIGALAYKPHMALIWPAILAMRGRWATFAVAGAVALALTGVSFLIVGPEPFKALLAGGAEVERYMAAGAYPLHRMTSLYASAVSLGLPAGAALGLHVAGALLALAGAVWAGRRLPEPAQMGLAIMSTVFLSPYFYDYDQPVFGVGLALILPELAARTTRLRLGLLLTVVAIAQVAGLTIRLLPVHLSFGGPLLLTAFGVMLHALAQAPARRESADPLADLQPIGAISAV
jgi:hypothetical protein